MENNMENTTENGVDCNAALSANISFKQLAEQIAQGVMEGAITPEEAIAFLNNSGETSDNLIVYLATAKDRQNNTVEEDFDTDEWKEKREKWNGLCEYLSKYAPMCLWQPNKGVFPDYEYSFLLDLDDGKMHTVSGRTLVDWVNSKNNDYVIIETVQEKFKVLVEEGFKNRGSLLDNWWTQCIGTKGVNVSEGLSIVFDTSIIERVESKTNSDTGKNTYIIRYKNGKTQVIIVEAPTEVVVQKDPLQEKIDAIEELIHLPKDELMHVINTHLTYGSKWNLESFAFDTAHNRFGFLVARTEEDAERAFRASAMEKLFDQPVKTLSKISGVNEKLLLRFKKSNDRTAIYGMMEATDSFERYYDEMKRQYGRGYWIAKDGNEIKTDCGYYLYFS